MGIDSSPAPQAPEDSQRKPRILLVDDEQQVLRSLKRLLRREPYVIETANDAATALAILEEQPVNLIISDQRMPGTTGTELLDQVRRRWPETIRIILSGYSEVNAILKAINVGAVYKYLTKPWNDEEIKLHIRRALELATLKEENRRLLEESRCKDSELERQRNDSNWLQHLDAGGLIFDGQGRILECNRRAEDLLQNLEIRPVEETSQRTLPPELLPLTVNCCDPGQGRLGLCGHELQWRCRPLDKPEAGPLYVLTIWEEVSTVGATLDSPTAKAGSTFAGPAL